MFSLVKKSKQLSWLLRHDYESYEKGLIDEFGWRSVDELKEHGFTEELIQEIVITDNKQRYELSSDYTKIRARQGHSIPVDVELKVATIIDDNHYLWHGTSYKFIENIKKHGLFPGARLYVHLSGDEKTAYNVGKRHGGQTYIICIDAYKMIIDGLKIYISNNGVYNTKYVDPKYFVEIKLVEM